MRMILFVAIVLVFLHLTRSEAPYVEKDLLVSAAEHELAEGYFQIGSHYVIVKPDGDLYRDRKSVV